MPRYMNSLVINMITMNDMQLAESISSVPHELDQLRMEQRQLRRHLWLPPSAQSALHVAAMAAGFFGFDGSCTRTFQPTKKLPVGLEESRLSLSILR